MLLFMAAGLVLAANPRVSGLQQKMEEISSLREKILEKIDQGTDIREYLRAQTQELTKEIKEEQKRLGDISYEKAVRSPCIEYDLKLLQQYYAYISEIDRRLTYFQAGEGQLAYLFQEAEDDLKIIEALNDIDIDSLMIRIDEALDEYLPETKTHLIRLDDIRLPEQENIWSEIMKKGKESGP